MAWEVKTHLHEPNPNARGVRSARGLKGFNGLVHCPCCGAEAPRFALLDVSMLPVELTQGYQYVCDGCWTRWERDEVVLPDGTVFDEARMYELMGAPAHVIHDARVARDHYKRATKGTPIPNRGKRPPEV